MMNRDRIIDGWRRVAAAVSAFFTAPASTKPLAVFRMGLATVLLAQAFSLLSDVSNLFGQEGLIRWEVTYNAQDPSPMAWAYPHLHWMSGFFGAAGLSHTAGLYLVFGTYIAALCMLLVGWKTRMACVATFVLQVFLSNTSPATVYGVDAFARVSLFYALWMPLGASYSFDAWLRRGENSATVTARIGLRLLQLHLGLMYLASGIEKGMGAQWWNGEAIWRAVTMPELAQYDMTWLADVPWLPVMLGWGTVILEVAYIALLCHHRTRIPAALAIISMHVGIALFMGLISFACLMIVLNTAAFLIPTEPQTAVLGAKSTAPLPLPVVRGACGELA